MNKEAENIIEIRDFRPDDVAFIKATWLRGLYYGDSWFNTIPKNIFMYHYAEIIDVLLASPHVTVKVACLKDSPDVIVGYSALSADFQKIHWCHVKKEWRRNGIARALLPQYPTAVTHLTALGRSLLPKFQNCVFNPFALE